MFSDEQLADLCAEAWEVGAPYRPPLISRMAYKSKEWWITHHVRKGTGFVRTVKAVLDAAIKLGIVQRTKG